MFLVRRAGNTLLFTLRKVYLLLAYLHRKINHSSGKTGGGGKMRISQSVSYSLAASATTPNLLSSINLQYIGLASKLTIWAAAFLAAALDTFSLTWSRGAEFGTLVPAGSPFNINANGPQQLNDLVGEFTIPAGANLVLALAAGATATTHTGVFRFLVES